MPEGKGPKFDKSFGIPVEDRTTQGPIEVVDEEASVENEKAISPALVNGEPTEIVKRSGIELSFDGDLLIDSVMNALQESKSAALQIPYDLAQTILTFLMVTRRVWRK